MTERNASYFFHRFEKAYREGGDPQAAQGRLMRSIADAISVYGSIPSSLAPTLRDLRDTWATDQPDAGVLRRARIAVWTELETKNGDSITITDATDRTLRAILCLADLVEPGDVADTAGWAAEMLSTEHWPRPTKFF